MTYPTSNNRQPWYSNIPEFIAQQYYRHGLFCASQVKMNYSKKLAKIQSSVVFSFGCCFYFLKINSVSLFRQPIPILLFAIFGIVWACYPFLTVRVFSGDAQIWTDPPENSSGQGDRPRWMEKQPVAYIQQVPIMF